MSRAPYMVRFDADGHTLFGEYDGTCNRILPALHRTWMAVSENWRKDAPVSPCSCGGDEPAVLAEGYAEGSHGPVRACRTCLVVTDTADAEREATGEDGALWKDGLPPWAVELGW